MPKANRRCMYCGKEYYVCLTCAGVHSWKKIACSPECFKSFMKQMTLDNLNKQKTEETENFLLESE